MRFHFTVHDTNLLETDIPSFILALADIDVYVNAVLEPVTLSATDNNFVIMRFPKYIEGSATVSVYINYNVTGLPERLSAENLRTYIDYNHLVRPKLITQLGKMFQTLQGDPILTLSVLGSHISRGSVDIGGSKVIYSLEKSPNVAPKSYEEYLDEKDIDPCTGLYEEDSIMSIAYSKDPSVKGLHILYYGFDANSVKPMLVHELISPPTHILHNGTIIQTSTNPLIEYSSGFFMEGNFKRGDKISLYKQGFEAIPTSYDLWRKLV